MDRNIHNVLFDLDGTLADTAPDLADTLNQLLQEQGLQPLPFEDIRPTVSHGSIVMINTAFGMEESDPGFGRLRARFLEIYAARLTSKTRLFQGIVPLLERLEGSGRNWGVVTNKPDKLTQPLLQALGIRDRTPCIVSGDTLAFSKPHPAPMLHACRLLQCNPQETLYVGDARRDVEAGRNTGMYTLIAAYGYIGPEDDPGSWGADGMVDEPGKIMEWIENNEVRSQESGVRSQEKT